MQKPHFSMKKHVFAAKMIEDDRGDWPAISNPPVRSSKNNRCPS